MCSNPHGGLIHAVLNRLWSRKCKISYRKLENSSYLFHFPIKILVKGLFKEACGMLMIVYSLWLFGILPVSVILKNIPDSCFLLL